MLLMNHGVLLSLESIQNISKQHVLHHHLANHHQITVGMTSHVYMIITVNVIVEYFEVRKLSDRSTITRQSKLG